MNTADVLRVPDTPLTRETQHLVATVLPPALLNHALRSYLLAKAYAGKRRLAYDEEGLYIAALFHDWGLCAKDSHPRLPFPINSSLTMVAFLEEKGVPKERVSPLVDAIDFHCRLFPRWSLGHEFAGSKAQAAAILASWSTQAREQVMLFQGLDYLYLVIYPAFISLGCARVARRLFRLAPRLAYLGMGLSWFVVTAGLFDAVENYALLQQVITGPSDLWAPVAWWCALPKFGLVVIGLGYMLAGYTISRVQSTGNAEKA